ncbi:hypothetical protein [Aureibaculum luteum]|uniref:hypothetical protein n=1 Tax=Aureibaculum luteum TaxID=1548456 RepID=UPI000E4846E5|nr:hypothetical protein [Aureibaculum luteum]
MKKLIVLVLVSSILFTSCTKENDQEPKDPIIGAWKPIKEVEVYTDNSISEFSNNNCNQKSRFIFFEDGSLDFIEYANDEVNDDCEKRTEPVLTFGSWERSVNGSYRIITTYTYTANQHSYTDDNIPDVFIFENNNNTLKFGYNDDEIINGKQLKHYYTEFLRVE